MHILFLRSKIELCFMLITTLTETSITNYMLLVDLTKIYKIEI